ncbi:helix-turn-helix transcriptional regulator [Clostridium baratii]
MLGDNIKREMKNRNILAKDLANAIGITPTYLSYILNNKRKNPSMELLNKIASFLNVSVDTFFDDNSKNKEKKERDYSLSLKEQEIIDDEAKKIIDNLSLSFSKNKDYLTEEDYFAIENALRTTLEAIKIKNKKKFTPKKFK